MFRVFKTLSLTSAEFKLSDEGGTFAGYASVFGGVDSYGDTILRGAFAETLEKNGLPKMFYNHDWDMPIGKFKVAKEDDKGLWVEGDLTPGLSKSGDIRAAMKHGTIDAMSIGGYLKRGDYDVLEDGKRVINKWSNLIEVSPVVFPADSAAKIHAETIKSAEFESEVEAIETIKDFERFLRDAGGFSKGAAQALIARVKLLPDLRDAEEAQRAKYEAQLLDRIAKIAKL
jgi:HK97 family phage prohead protease